MKKKIILGVTLFLMLLTLFALSVSAASKVTSWDISATSSDNVTATLYDDYSLVISGSGNVKDWTSSSKAPWYSSYSSKIKSVTIENGVTNIGDYAFYYCDALTSVVIPDSVTTIGNSAFEDCTALTSVVIPDSVTSIGSDAFEDCDALTSVELPDSVTTIGYSAFYSCEALTSIVIGDSVTSIGEYAFSHCDALTSIVIPEGVTSIGNGVFIYCYKLVSIVIPEGVTSIGASAFGSCESLTSIELPDSVTSISARAFENCKALKSVVIPNSVTSIGSHAFEDCDTLVSVVIPNSVTTIGAEAFYSCERLTIFAEATSKPSDWSSNWNYSSRPVYWGIKDYGYTDNGLVWVVLKSESTATVVGYMNFVKELIIPEKVNGYTVTAIDDYVFYKCTSLASVKLPNGLKTIGEYAFSQCKPLTSIEIPDSVTTISEDAFSYSALKSVKLSNSLKTIGIDAFYDCTSLRVVVIPASVTYIGSSAFSGCDKLTIYAEATGYSAAWSSYWNVSKRPVNWGIEDYGYTDNGLICVILKGKSTATIVGYMNVVRDVIIPESVNGYAITTINEEAFYASNLTSIVICDSIKTIGEKAFYSCDALTSVVIPNSVTTINQRTFYNCPALISVELPNSVTTIGNDAFSSCDALTSVVIPDSVTSIGEYAFYSCDALTSVVIPDSVKTIGKYAFCYCTSLTSVVIPDSVTTIGNDVFTNCSSLTAYCEVAKRPNGWNSDWKPSSRPVVWDYKNVLQGNIVIFKGYSFNEAGSMAVGFDIDYEAKALYEELTGEALEIGVVFAAYDLLLGQQPLDNEGNAITLDDGAVVKFDLTEYDYTYYDFVITDIVDSIKDIDLVISAYINNGYENKYVQENGISDTVYGISYNEAKA